MLNTTCLSSPMRENTYGREFLPYSPTASRTPHLTCVFFLPTFF